MGKADEGFGGSRRLKTGGRGRVKRPVDDWTGSGEWVFWDKEKRSETTIEATRTLLTLARDVGVEAVECAKVARSLLGF